MFAPYLKSNVDIKNRPSKTLFKIKYILTNKVLNIILSDAFQGIFQ